MDFLAHATIDTVAQTGISKLIGENPTATAVLFFIAMALIKILGDLLKEAVIKPKVNGRAGKANGDCVFPKAMETTMQRHFDESHRQTAILDKLTETQQEAVKNSGTVASILSALQNGQESVRDRIVAQGTEIGLLLKRKNNN